MNPDPDTTRQVRAEQFERLMAKWIAKGLSATIASMQVALEHPHLACAAEQMRHPPELQDEVQRLWNLQNP